MNKFGSNSSLDDNSSFTPSKGRSATSSEFVRKDDLKELLTNVLKDNLQQIIGG